MKDPIDVKLSFRTKSLHTDLAECSHAISGVACRVCAAPLVAGELIRRRDWGLEYAHHRCGWFRNGELGRINEPRELRRPGTSFAFFEWRCPQCLLDACSSKKPRDTDSPLCIRCRPIPEFAKGVTVETISGASIAFGRQPRRYVLVPSGTRGVVDRIVQAGIGVSRDVLAVVKLEECAETAPLRGEPVLLGRNLLRVV